MSDTADPDAGIITKRGSASRWITEIEKAEKRDKSFVERGRKIIRRYRDQGPNTDQPMRSGRRRFNVLWSNVQTLKPAIYGRPPKPVCERRFLDRDPTGRIASTILERTLSYDIEMNGFHDHMSIAVDDLLLPGRGVLWARYEPRFGEEISPEQEGGSPYDREDQGGSGEADDRTPDAGEGDAARGEAGGVDGDARDGLVGGDDGGEYGAGDAPDVIDECVYPDYVFWEDFLTSQARVWSEVTWVGRRLYMGKPEMRERAKAARQAGVKGWRNWLKIPIQTPRGVDGRFQKRMDGEDFAKGEVFEIWCKETERVKFVSKGVPDIIEERDDPLGLECFWPTPRPMFATQTSDRLEPVPDYAEYQDQAEELDTLTNRIASLTRALKVAGVYDASMSGLQRLLDEGVDNKLIPVEAWASLAQKGGLEASISWLPIKEIAAVLIQLFEARERIKQDLYEITGIADIIRGQSDPNETLGAQKIKGSFATQRLQARQMEVARYCRDFLAIHAEIASEHYAPETLILKSSIMEDDGLDEDQEPTPQGPPGMGHNGGPPMDSSAPPQNGGIPTSPGSMGGISAISAPPPDPQAAKLQQIMAAIALLKNEKLRGFRVDVETDSTIAMDRQQDKETAVEFVTAVSGYLEKMTQAALTPAGPIIIPFAGKMLGWAVRRFGTGRELEAPLDRFMQAANQAMQQAAQSQGEEDPAMQVEKVKAEAEMQKAQADGQMAQMKGQIELQKMQMEMAIKQATAEQEKQMAELKVQLEYAKMQMEMQKAQREDELAQAEHSRQMQLGSLQILQDQEGHRANMEGIEAKRKAAANGGAS
jgi:hypothetical protein